MRRPVAEIKDAVAGADRILIVTHIEPDGDALGSLVGLALALQQLGKKVTMVCDDGMLSRFSYLPLRDQVEMVVPDNVTFDLMIALDCGDESRMGRAFADLPEPVPPVINIDHHITNTYFGSIDYVDGAATSTCEILYSLLPQLGATWTPDLASAILTGIVTDTLCFRTVGVTSNTLHAASQLMSAGANLAEINMRAINVKPLDMMTLYQKGLNNMRLDNGLLWTSISVAEREAAGLQGFGNGGLASMLGDVSEAAMGAVLTEMEDGRVKANFRCRPPFDVAEVAVNLGGGGHALASGCTLDGPLNRAEALVVDVAKEAIKRQREMFG